MAGGRKKRVGVKRSSKVDWLSILPESLLCKVFLNLPTEDVVRTSVLSKRWRNLWKYLPGLDLDHDNFPIYCVDGWDIQMPPTLYTCDSIVSLKLNGIELAGPKFVSLPCLKFMDSTMVHFEDGVDLETLISGCSVLENLYITTCPVDDIKVIRVCSQSLLRFTLDVDFMVEDDEDDAVAEINATRLQYLRLGHSLIGNFILNNLSSLVEAYIDTFLNRSFENKLKTDLQENDYS